MEGVVGGSNALRVPLYGKVWLSKKSRQVVAAHSLCPEKSTPDRTEQLQERERGEAVLDRRRSNIERDLVSEK